VEKKCLIIDDEDQSTNIDDICRKARPKGLQIICTQLEIGKAQTKAASNRRDLSFGDVVQLFKDDYGHNRFDIVAIDWHLGPNDFNGVELLRQLRAAKLLLKTPVILYSGLLKSELGDRLEGYKNDGKPTKTEIIALVNTLIRSGVQSFVDRVSYEQEIVNQLLLGSSLDLIVENELRRFPGLIFKTEFLSQSFAGKRFDEVAKILEDNDHLRHQFKDEIIKQVIAYLTESL
jgi:DNA-binding response OmpR family regulator